jgi:hypothetical protein
MQLEELLDWHESPQRLDCENTRVFGIKTDTARLAICAKRAEMLHALDYFEDVVEDIGFVNKMLDSGSLDL